jgi:hypothetical protein
MYPYFEYSKWPILFMHVNGICCIAEEIGLYQMVNIV